MMELTAERLKTDALHIGTLDLEPLTLPYRKLYRVEYAEQARKLCLMGLDDPEVADFFDTDLETLQTWKRLYRPLTDAIDSGRVGADAKVASSLYERAIGYNRQVVKVYNYRGKITLKTITKHVPADIRASIFWLTNRQPELWGKQNQAEYEIAVCK